MGNATNRWLDRLADADKSDGGTGSDYQLAKLLGIDRQQVSKYRRDVDDMGEAIAVRLADLLDVPPMKVVGEIKAERAKDPRTQSFWSDAAVMAKAARSKAKGALAGAAVMMTAMGFGVVSQPAEAAGFSSPGVAAYSTIYTMRALHAGRWASPGPVLSGPRRFPPR